MKVIDTSVVLPGDLSPMEREWVYNGMDSLVTLEIMETIKPQLDAHTGRTYEFSKALQGPTLEMRLRGIKVDQARRAEVVDEFFEQIDKLERQLDRIVFEGIGLPNFSWRSNKDLAHLFYDVLQIPAPRGKRSVNRDNLEKLDAYLIARQVVRHITAMRDIQKKIDVLRTEIDPDGRARTSYNIAGTNTGRFSSSLSEFGTGGNQQNTEESLRSMFIADPGMKFAKFDGAQIQSRVVGAVEWNLFHDGKYLDACESGDLHTTVAKLTWPELPWTGDLDQDRALAEQPYYRHYDRRFMCKKLGHGTNFDGLPPTLATQSRVPVLAVAEFQRVYHRTFPAHRQWRDWTDNTLRREGTYIALDGRKREFWGRRGDQAMVREALAYEGQSSESYITNTGMLNVWRANNATLIKQDHDAVTVQYPEEREDEIIPLIREQLIVPIELKYGRTLIVPYDAVVGWNLGKYDPKKNKMGLKEYAGGDTRKREKEIPILARKPKR